MSVANELSDAHNDALTGALKEVGRAEAAYEKVLAREKKALEQHEATKARARGSNLKRLSNAVVTARERAKQTTKLRKQAAARLREARNLLREQKQLAREAERKERAKQRAVAAFLKKWERDYDLEMKRKKKNIMLRKKEVRRG